MLHRLCIGTAILMGSAALANGIFMLASPAHWYFAIPGVTTTGPYNQHFIRDIGLVFLFVGAALLIGTERRQHRVALWAAATFWLGAHAFFHYWEVAVGICAPSALLRDFPAVTLPAFIGAGLTLWAMRDRRTVRRSHASDPVHQTSLAA
jgi:hypothetical protein